MNENLNLYEILKNTPKGTKFWSPTFGDLYLQDISPIKIIFSNASILNKPHTLLQFISNGTYYYAFNNAECSVFPSKDQRDWSKYQRPFKDGDIIYFDINHGNKYIAIFKDIENDYLHPYTYLSVSYSSKSFSGGSFDINCIQEQRLATEEEKHKLFQAIKNEGYQWNAETKSLEKLVVPKFKVGDRIRHKTTNKDDIYEISKVYDDSYGLIGFTWMIYMKYQDDYELVPNKFDISTLKPFDKVLVRDNRHGYWSAALFSHIGNNEFYPYIASCIKFKYCIPYNFETKHLVGTTLEEPEFYKNW